LLLALWQPSNITTSTVPTATIVQSIVVGRGGEVAQLVQAVETLHVIDRDGSYDATLQMRGSDFRADVSLGDANYAFGEVGEDRWRRTPSGSVRIIRSDVQGDPLDHWPRSVFGLGLSSCETAGAASLQGATLEVLACRPPGNPTLFYYVDPSSGHIVREVSREGARVVTYDFDDFRAVGSWAQPYHWKVSGADGDSDVTVVHAGVQAVPAAAIEIPQNVPEQFVLPTSGVAKIPGRVGLYTSATVEVNGRERTFLIDTGTTQTIIDIGEAARLGLHPLFGHAVVRELKVGDVVAHNLPVEAIDLFHDEIHGILGNEFFTGHIVHIDYIHRRVEVISHAAFKTPATAVAMAMDCREGMPLVRALVGSAPGDRFALDTASQQILLSASFVSKSHLSLNAYSTEQRTEHFLEGPVTVGFAVAPAIVLGGYRLEWPYAEVEEPDNDNVAFPLDGVIGTGVLTAFDLWFDYDNGTLWMDSPYRK
jgi:hypothetical protein